MNSKEKRGREGVFLVVALLVLVGGFFLINEGITGAVVSEENVSVNETIELSVNYSLGNVTVNNTFENLTEINEGMLFENSNETNSSLVILPVVEEVEIIEENGTIGEVEILEENETIELSIEEINNITEIEQLVNETEEIVNDTNFTINETAIDSNSEEENNTNVSLAVIDLFESDYSILGVDSNILLNWIYPTSNLNVSQHTFFNMTVNVTCSGSNCGEINVSLDPTTTYNFTTCGASGVSGPSQGNCDTSYTGTSLAGEVTIISGIQYWTVPATGEYNFVTAGASGGDGKRANGGRGRIINTTVSLTKDQVLKILVGQEGGHANYSTTMFVGGGGGGTFVVINETNSPLIVSGGGGGVGDGDGSWDNYVNGSDANDYDNQSGTDGIATPSSFGPAGLGGTNGNGGTVTTEAWGGGSGAGFYGDGSKTSQGSFGGTAFVSGGAGGANVLSGATNQIPGGFGGGAGAYLNTGFEADGGGAGGYSGGGGGAPRTGAGGGGGNFYNSTLATNVVDSGLNTGDGYVFISSSASAKNGLVSTNTSETPFYTNGTNPYNISLNAGESETITWWVNATGTKNTPYEFFVYANQTNDTSITNETSRFNITIIDTTAPGVAIDYPVVTVYDVNVTELNYTYTDLDSGGSCWYSVDSGATNSSTSNAGTDFTELSSSDGDNNWAVYCNDSSGNFGSDTVTFNSSVPSVGLTLITPTAASISQGVNVTANKTFTVSATVSCSNNNCGEINVTLNTSNSTAYNVTTSNPLNVTLTNGGSGTITWTINATGDVNTTNGFSVYANRTSDMSISDEISPWNVTIVNYTVGIYDPSVSITYPVSGTNYVTNVSELNYSVSGDPLTQVLDKCWYSTDNGATNSSNVSAGVNFSSLNSATGSNAWTIYCNDNNSLIGSGSVTFSKVPRISLEVIYPSASVQTQGMNVTLHEMFNVLANVSCSNVDCGEINVSLDPAATTAYNFTTCSATGRTGPSQANCDTNYTSTTLDGLVTVDGGVQNFTAPATGTYAIEVAGAEGGSGTDGSSVGGKGAIMKGDFSLTKGQVISILVGQQGLSDGGGGGGGGSFVWDPTSITLPLIVAGGGGGSGDGSTPTYDGKDATTLTSGVTSGGAGGTDGSGGTAVSSDGQPGAGAGWLTDATGGTKGGTNISTGNGYGGDNDDVDGGFGGGGAEHSTSTDSEGGGGGGGYSGGGATGSGDPGGGGGGSYNDGTNQNNTSGLNSGHGYVTITTTATSKSGLITNNSSATPYYTTSKNPFNVSLNVGESEIIKWYVNATGTVNTTHEFFTFANWTSDTDVNNKTSIWNVTIVDFSVSQITIDYPTSGNKIVNVSELNYTLSSDYTLDQCWYSADNGVTNSSLVSPGVNFSSISSSAGSNTWVVYCNDTLGVYHSKTVTFSKVPLIGLTMIIPTGDANVTQNETFFVSVNVSCDNVNCGEINVSLDPETDRTERTCSGVWGSSCEGPDPGVGDYSYDGCSAGSYYGSGFEVDEVYVDATTVAIGDTINITCTYDCYSSSNLNDIAIMYYNGTWTKLWNQDNACTDGNYSVQVNISGDLGEQYARCSIGYNAYPNDGATDTCFDTTYSDNDDVNFTVISADADKSGLITTNTSATPFYTTTNNPYNVSLNDGESEIVTWTVNATGTLNTTHEFFVYANWTSDMDINNITSRWNVTIVNFSVSPITIDYPIGSTDYITNVSELNYTLDSDYNLGSCWYSTDAGATNSTKSSAGTNFTNIISTAGSNTWVVYCNDSNNLVYTRSVAFNKIPIIGLTMVSPSPSTLSQGINVTANETFTVSTTVSCSNVNCGEINVSLDPASGTIYNFTTCGKIGYAGPSQGDCDTNYTGTTLADLVTVSGGIQNWTVPETGTYTIEIAGAQGGKKHTTEGGLGAQIIGTFSLTEGDVIQILVGQEGIENTQSSGSYGSAGGGGGTFVVDSDNDPLIIAGGGGGSGDSTVRSHATNETTGVNGNTGNNVGTGGTGGTNGGGGQSVSYGGGGAGWVTSGLTGSYGKPGTRFLDGGLGGWSYGGNDDIVSSDSSGKNGGFGGGAGSYAGGGGGGGYSGGGGENIVLLVPVAVVVLSI
ncbi:hypothetical protein HOC13_04430, partial [Candidatus Woesearchaeota archaeon]|nr:hypothetical protein [Candidatus Woesearchaeota archaeon]